MAARHNDDGGTRHPDHDPMPDLAPAEAWPRDPGTVERIETHISRLFLTAHRVYKVKKPLSLDFLDYSTPALRRGFCHEEVRLNRRLAPTTYLGVVPLTRDEHDRWHVAGDGTPRDWAVEMRRLPAAGMLDRRLEGGEIDNAMLDSIAELLVRFHRASDGSAEVRRHGTPDAVAALVEENLAELEPFIDAKGPLPAPLHAFLRSRARRILADSSALLRRRVEEGCIREGHGDLHAGNLCLTEKGWVVYDCIEFSHRFRCGDRALDLAFLAMDLDRRGFHAFSDYLAHRYAELADDSGLTALLPFYKAYRAAVRGKVACLGAQGLSGQARDETMREAAVYFQLAASYDLGPCLVLTCGLPASGKSWVAGALAARWGAARLRSDVRRKRLAGVPLHGSRGAAASGADLYSDDMTRRTYRSLLERTAAELDRGRSVIVDATFSRAPWRRPFLDLARERGVPLCVVHLRVSEAAARRRFERRRHDPEDPSDADFEVFRRARESFEEPTEVPPALLLETTTEGRTPEDLVGEITLHRIAG